MQRTNCMMMYQDKSRQSLRGECLIARLGQAGLFVQLSIQTNLKDKFNFS